MARRLASIAGKILGNKMYANIWVAFSIGIVSQIIGYTKYEGYFDLYWIIMKDGYIYLNL